MVKQLDAWLVGCKEQAVERKSCLIRPNATSIRNAMRLARRSEYTQEVSFFL